MNTELHPTANLAPLGRRLLRFLIGLAALAAFAGVFMSGLTPPGIAGEVLRHNRANQIDASPLLYSEVEHMHQLEAGVRQLRAAAWADRDASEPVDSSRVGD